MSCRWCLRTRWRWRWPDGWLAVAERRHAAAELHLPDQRTSRSWQHSSNSSYRPHLQQSFKPVREMPLAQRLKLRWSVRTTDIIGPISDHLGSDEKWCAAISSISEHSFNGCSVHVLVETCTMEQQEPCLYFGIAVKASVGSGEDRVQLSVQSVAMHAYINMQGMDRRFDAVDAALHCTVHADGTDCALPPQADAAG
jgi:hypothetical protein